MRFISNDEHRHDLLTSLIIALKKVYFIEVIEKATGNFLLLKAVISLITRFEQCYVFQSKIILLNIHCTMIYISIYKLQVMQSDSKSLIIHNENFYNHIVH